MKATVSQPQSWQRILDIEISNEEVEQGFGTKLTEYKKKVQLPGFRQGKIPVELLKSRFGASIKAEVIDDLINKTYRDACKENKIEPISEAKISDLKAEDNKPVTFKVEVEVDPAIEITGYKKLKVRPIPKKIKDSDVDSSLEELRDRMAEIKDVERPSAKGDLVTIEYISATIDGEPRPGLTSPRYPIELGKGTLKDFDKGLNGLSAGEETDITVKFPKDYHVEDVAGKTAELKVKVTKVQEKIVPQVDDAFCKKVGGFDNEEKLREQIRKDIEAQELERARTEAHDKAIDDIIKQNDFDVPPARIAFYLQKVAEEQAQYYPPGKAPSREELEEKFHDAGVRALKRYRIVDYIAEKEKIKATQEEVDQKIQILAQRYGQPFEEVKVALRKNGTTMRIREDIKDQKTLDCLIGVREWEVAE